jgi:hypothetical protein
MMRKTTSNDIYLEIGTKKVFAVAVDWPGWCRYGRDEPSALQALWRCGPRYARIAQAGGFEFQIPERPSSFNIVHRLEGNATTDFGGPDRRLPNDWDPIGDLELERMREILQACWLAFDAAVEQGEGKELRKGPRGGGRDLARIIEHVVAAEEGYLKALGWKPAADERAGAGQRVIQLRNDVLRGLQAAAAGRLPRVGPRGGERWPPRFFVRRLAWHAVDHAWEIEDRIID